MIVTALKCDFCKKVLEVDDLPDGWATITSMVTIRGTHHGTRGKIYRDRRDAIRAKVKKMHMCDDCIEATLTGKISLKIGHG